MNRTKLKEIITKPKADRIYIIPTRFGFIYTTIVVCILLSAASFGVQKGNFIVVGMVTVGLMAMFMTHANLEKIGIDVSSEAYQVEELPGKLTLYLQNESDTEHFSLMVCCPSLGAKEYDQGHYIGEGENTHISVHTNPQKCGFIPVNRLKISSRYPLGLFYAWKWFDIDKKIVSYPYPSGIHWYEASGRQGRPADGEKKDDFEFSGHSKYKSGDNCKRIDWKAKARGRPLMIKEYKGGEDGDLIFDMHHLNYLPIKEQLSQMSLWIHEAHAQGASYGIKTRMGSVPISTGEGHFYRCLKELTRNA